MGALVAVRGAIAHPDRVGHDPERRQHPGQPVGGDRLAGFRFCPWAALDRDQAKVFLRAYVSIFFGLSCS